MSQMINIVVKDADTTTDLTLKPVSCQNNTAVWRAAKTGVPQFGQVSLDVNHNEGKGLQTRREKIKITVPYLETVASGSATGYVAQPKLAYANTVEIIVTVNKRTSDTDAKFLRQLAAQIIGEHNFGTATVNNSLTNIWELYMYGTLPV